MKDLVIYHKNCTDGFAAAFAFWLKYKNTVEYFPACYGQEPPIEKIKNNTVYIVDFSYDAPTTLKLMDLANHVVVLDHHVTSRDALKGLPQHNPKLHIEFDMDRSGAMLAWDYLNIGVESPMLFKFVQDRDLWQFYYPLSKPVVTALYAKPFVFEEWVEYLKDHKPLVELGNSLLTYRENEMAAIINSTRRTINLGDHFVPLVNCYGSYSSEIGNTIARGHDFGVTYYDTKSYRIFSLRGSKDSPVDVSEVAKLHGGGGHPNAAGFTVKRDHKLAQI